MSALDQLERSLARVVDAGAAADPASTDRRRALPGRRLRPRRGWHVFVAILLAGGMTTGALAATGQLKILGEHKAPYMPMVGDQGAGVPSTPIKVLPLRVADPLGGPPWVIRTFTTNRQAGCAQAGQLYRGQFGITEQDARGKTVFRVIGVHIGETARCTNALHEGFPVLRGLRNVSDTRGAVAADGKPCRANAPGAVGGPEMRPCPITAVRLMRFGLLGKDARSARLVRADGSRSKALAIAPDTGGAYLFVEKIDPKPFQAADEIQWKANLAASTGPSMSGKNPDELTPAERDRDAKAMRARMQAASRISLSPEARRTYRALRARDGVDVTFADGSTFRVAGSGVAKRGLPGVQPVKDTLPKTLPAPITATWQGRNRAIAVSFPAPVALDRFARAYRVSVRGPLPPTCHVMDSQIDYVMKAPTAGETVRVQLRRLQRPGVGFMPWCKGKRYTVRVVHHSGTSPGGVDRPVGETSFVGR